MLLAKKILESQRGDRLQRLASLHSLEEELVHSRWLAECMEEKLSEIWVSSMSIAALDWYVEVILGSTTGATYCRITKLAHDILNSAADVRIGEEDQDIGIGEEDQNKMSLARDIATAVVPPLGESKNIGRVTRGIQRDVPTEGLQELGTQLFSSAGRMYIEGYKTKFVDEWVAISGFIFTIARR